MVSIATIGPKGSHGWQAAKQYRPDATIMLLPHSGAAFEAFEQHETDLALVPVYNTREGQSKEFSSLMKKINRAFWIDNVVLPIHLSLGSLDAQGGLNVLLGKNTTLRQCEGYIADSFPEAMLIATHDLDGAVAEIKERGLAERGVIESEAALREYGLAIREREITPFNRSRFAVLGRKIPAPTGYDATSVITTPLKDRVGMLFEMLGEFTNRGINLLDMHSETDPKSQMLQFFIEMEGHIDNPGIREALERIEKQVIQEPGSIKVLGSYPRVDMRTKRIKNFGFIGSGDMSRWFAGELESEGYETVITGRSSAMQPEQMIPQVDVVVVCVPISATPATIEKYGPLLRDDQALILLAGEAEHILDTALHHTGDGVEVMLVHNLWGPKADTMKDKNASVVRTVRSGVLCSEFEAFLYKHGAKIRLDEPRHHDLMMGVNQKLPTSISMAMAMTLREHAIDPDDIGSHATLTSLYSILSMARVHFQNPRTYAEILSCPGEGHRIVRSFAENLIKVLDMAAGGDIQKLCEVIEQNREFLTDDFLRDRMRQALEVDKTLGRVIRR